MKLQVNKTKKISGQAVIPGSKSHAVRAFVVAMLAEGKSELRNILDCEDVRNALSVCRALGAEIQEEKQESQMLRLIVNNNSVTRSVLDSVNSGNSGITTRFMLPVLGLRKDRDRSITLDCGEQMKKRPIDSLVKALNNLGMNVNSLNDDSTCPLEINGQLKGGKASVDGITSQYISALLLSLPCAENDSQITVNNLQEAAYVDITLSWLDQQGIIYSVEQKENRRKYYINGGQSYQPLNMDIPGDFSSASYLIVASVILPGELTIQGLDMSDMQPDKQLIEILQQMGADIKVEKQGITIRGGQELQGTRIDCNNIPDMVPTFAVVGTYAAGKTEIVNTPQARIKETDRIHSIYQGLTKMGARMEEREDGMTVYQSGLRGASVRGYEDHRTIMALAVAGLIAEGKTEIDTAQGINKTFPTFVELMQSIGAKINIQD